MPKIEGCYFGDRDISKVIYQNKVIYKKTYESLLKLTKNFLIIKENKISGIKNIFQRKIKKGDRTEIVLESYTKQELKELTPFLNDIAKKKEKIVFNLDIGEFSEGGVELYDANGLIFSKLESINGDISFISKCKKLEELKMPMLIFSKYDGNWDTIFRENKIKILDLGRLNDEHLNEINYFPSLETLILRGESYGDDDITISLFGKSKNLKEIYLYGTKEINGSFINKGIYPEKVIANNITFANSSPCNSSKLKHIELNELIIGDRILKDNNIITNINLPKYKTKGDSVSAWVITGMFYGFKRIEELDSVIVNYIVDCFKNDKIFLDPERLKKPMENESYIEGLIDVIFSGDISEKVSNFYFFQGIFAKKEIKKAFKEIWENIDSDADEFLKAEGVFSNCNNLKDICLNKLKFGFAPITRDCPNLKNIYLESCEELDIDKSFVNSGKPTIHISRKCKILSNNIGAKIEYID